MGKWLNLFDMFTKSEADAVKTMPKLSPNFVRNVIKNNENIQSRISKVMVTSEDNNIVITPKMFANDKGTEVDYIGVYIIGMLEMLYRCLPVPDASGVGYETADIPELENFQEFIDAHKGNTITITDAQRKLANLYNKMVNNMSQLVKVLDDYNDLENPNSALLKPMQVFLSMRTNCSDRQYKFFMKNANHFMIMYMMNQSLFWEVFFEIMEVCLTFVIDLIDVGDSGKFIVAQDKIDEFKYFEYTIPNTNSHRKITNCPSFCISMTLYFYFTMLKYHGSSVSRSIIKHDNPAFCDILHTVALNCLGNDDQSKILRGIFRTNRMSFDCNGIYVYDNEPKLFFELQPHTKVSRCLYEEIILYTRSRNIDTIPRNIHITQINMHYACEEYIFEALGEILYYSPTNIMTKQIITELETFQQFKRRYDELELIVKKSDKRIEDINNKANKRIEEEKQESEKEIEKLKEEINRLNRINESKSSIIERLSQENKQLNAIVTNIYSDDDFDESIEDVPIETMIDTINTFQVSLIGGRAELLIKLQEMGLNNVRQVGKDDFITHWDAVKTSDFFVINSRFCSHTVVNKVTSNITDTNQIIYFNGTNPNKLVEACYQSIVRYIE